MTSLHTETNSEAGVSMLQKAARESVFPMDRPIGDGGRFLSCGITKRELFAAMAMQSLLPALWNAESFKVMKRIGENRGINGSEEMIAWLATQYADGLLKALSDEEQS